MNKVVVLYAEDEPTDVLFLRRAIRMASLPIELRTVSDGTYLIHWLAGTATYRDRKSYPVPELVITDLKMPLAHGFEVLKFIRQNRQLRSLPVVVYTTSTFPTDLENAVRFGAVACLHKTHTCADLIDFLRNWLITRHAEALVVH